MRARELIDNLEKLDPDLEVFACFENPVIVEGRALYLLEVEYVSVCDVIGSRNDDGYLDVQFSKGVGSRHIGLINLSADL